MTAATALEARPEHVLGALRTPSLKKTATRLPILVGVIYFLAALMIALSVDSTSPSLPAQGWVSTITKSQSRSNSAFVQAAEAAGIKGLPTVISVFIVVTAVTTTNTLIYVASRTLYGLVYRSISNWKELAQLSDIQKVPMRAVWASILPVSLIPFLSYIKSGPGTTIIGVLPIRTHI